MKKKRRSRDPIARALRKPRFRPKVVPDKTKKKPRKRKHKGGEQE